MIDVLIAVAALFWPAVLLCFSLWFLEERHGKDKDKCRR